LRIYNNYLLSLALVTCITNVLLAVFGQSDITIYFVVNTIIYIAITLLFIYFNPRARIALRTIGFVLFGIFLVMITMTVISII